MQFINGIVSIRKALLLTICIVSRLILFSQDIDPVFVIDEINDEYALNDYSSVLEDADNDILIDELIKNQGDYVFSKYTPAFEFDPSKSYWIKTIIDNSLEDLPYLDKWKLFSGNTDVLDVFLISNENKIIGSFKGGQQVPASKKTISFGNKVNRVELSIGPDYPVTLYTKIYRLNRQGLSLNLTLSKHDFYESWNFVKVTRRDWLFMGFTLTMFFFSMVFFIVSRDKAFFYHGLFILGVVLFILDIFSVAHDLTWVKNNPYLVQGILVLGLALIDIGYFQFVRHYMNLEQLMPRWNQWFIRLVQLKIIFYTLATLGNYLSHNEPFFDKIIAFFLISQYLVVLLFLIPLYRTKDKKGLFLIIGTSLLFIGIIANTTSMLQGFGLWTTFTEISLTGEILCFSLGLGYRIREFQREAFEREREVNKKLVHFDKLKDQFLANTSHELKTPLQGIIGIAESMRETETDNLKKEELDLIAYSGKRLNSLVNDLLNYSKLKNDDIVPTKKVFELNVLTDIVIKLLAPLVRKKNLKFIQDIPRNLPLIEIDENHLQQILINLISNAIKFTDEGIIKLTARAEPDGIMIAIRDTGIGIPEEKLDLIFKEFQQADGSISREYQGTGLGLSISKQLIELNGGEIFVNSKLGKGSTFRIKFPIASKQKISEDLLVDVNEKIVIESIEDTGFNNSYSGQETLIPPSNEFAQKKYRVLIIDDEPINQKVLGNYLKDPIYELYSAMSGIEALKIIEQSPKFDLILLDLMMPRMSGYEVCEKIRKTHLPSEMPIIMVTAKNQMEDLTHGFEVGANDYIPKPFTKGEFLARVKTQLNLHNINQATSRFVPIDFIKALGKETITEVSLGDHVEEKVTVFFSDIRSYATLAEQMNLKENFNFVLDHVSAMGPIITKNKGFVNQYLGDSIMAIFSNSAKDALQASIEMQQTIERLNKSVKNPKHSLNVGMGFHTGNLMMGIIGDIEHSQTVTIADTVNLASRIEGLTKFFGTKILLSGESMEDIPDKSAFDFRYLGKVLVKGRSNLIDIYECINGHDEYIYRKKKESMEIFSQGLANYFQKDFPQATVAFQDILNLNPDDKVAKHFLKKAAYYISQEIPEDWTGTEIMTGKS